MQPTSVQSIAFAGAPSLPVPPLVFGFPRHWLPRQLRARLTQSLCISLAACEIGYRDADGAFTLLDESDDHDGPAFTLRLTCAKPGQPLRTHDIDLHVTILNNHYQLQASGRQFDIAFLPAADAVQLAAAARWMLRHLD